MGDGVPSIENERNISNVSMSTITDTTLLTLRSTMRRVASREFEIPGHPGHPNRTAGN